MWPDLKPELFWPAFCCCLPSPVLPDPCWRACNTYHYNRIFCWDLEKCTWKYCWPYCWPPGSGWRSSPLVLLFFLLCLFSPSSRRPDSRPDISATQTISSWNCLPQLGLQAIVHCWTGPIPSEETVLHLLTVTKLQTRYVSLGLKYSIIHAWLPGGTGGPVVSVGGLLTAAGRSAVLARGGARLPALPVPST